MKTSISLSSRLFFVSVKYLTSHFAGVPLKLFRWSLPWCRGRAPSLRTPFSRPSQDWPLDHRISVFPKWAWRTWWLLAFPWDLRGSRRASRWGGLKAITFYSMAARLLLSLHKIPSCGVHSSNRTFFGIEMSSGSLSLFPFHSTLYGTLANASSNVTSFSVGMVSGRNMEPKLM